MKPDDPFAIGTRLLFANDRVRLWTLEVAPGETWGPHEHSHEYVTVVARGSHIASIMDDGSTEIEFDAEVDHVDWHGPLTDRRVHTLANLGEAPYKNFIVELLD